MWPGKIMHLFGVNQILSTTKNSFVDSHVEVSSGDRATCCYAYVDELFETEN